MRWPVVFPIEGTLLAGLRIKWESATLGSKARVLGDLVSLIGEPGPRAGRFVDAFSGTGVVASVAADLG